MLVYNPRAVCDWEDNRIQKQTQQRTKPVRLTILFDITYKYESKNTRSAKHIRTLATDLQTHQDYYMSEAKTGKTCFAIRQHRKCGSLEDLAKLIAGPPISGALREHQICKAFADVTELTSCQKVGRIHRLNIQS